MFLWHLLRHSRDHRPLPVVLVLGPQLPFCFWGAQPRHRQMRADLGGEDHATMLEFSHLSGDVVLEFRRDTFD